MKVNKHFTIEENISNKLLDESNASQLVNSLLEEHYNSIEIMSKEEIKKKIIENETDKSKLEEYIKFLKDKLKSIEKKELELEKLKRVPSKEDIEKDFNMIRSSKGWNDVSDDDIKKIVIDNFYTEPKTYFKPNNKKRKR